MKIRNGHVSNSSSSSFALVISNISNSDKTVVDFFKEVKEEIIKRIDQLRTDYEMFDGYEDEEETKDNNYVFEKFLEVVSKHFTREIIPPKKISGFINLNTCGDDYDHEDMEAYGRYFCHNMIEGG